jgi:hypothetical protein
MNCINSLLFNYTTLSPDMINTIDKYLDQEIENPMKFFNKEKSKTKYILRKDITLREIFILCLREGKAGFYLYKDCSLDIISDITKMIETEKLTNIITIDSPIDTIFIIKEFDNKEYEIISLTRIDCCELVKK